MCKGLGTKYVITLSDTNLDIEPAFVKEKIISVIKNTLEERDCDRLLVIFSGQNDSYTAVKLAISAVGLDSVKIAIISDVSTDRRKEISETAVKLLNFKKENIISFDVKNICNQFDSLDGLIPEISGNVPSIYVHNINHLLLRSNVVQKILVEKTYSHIGKISSGPEKFYQEIIAHNKVRKRIKALLAYLIAERENLVLVSKTNKTELLAGLFTPFGYGHAADIMPLGDLYRTQVLQLAEYLEVPKEIRDLAYTEIIPGITNKYQYFFELESKQVDKILIRLELGWKPINISDDLKIDLEKVERVNHFYKISSLQRKVPIIPQLNAKGTGLFFS
jgi:NAD+ synthase